jgi:hypothetical protein
METDPGPLEVNPEAVEVILEPWRLTPKQCGGFTLEPRREVTWRCGG